MQTRQGRREMPRTALLWRALLALLLGALGPGPAAAAPSTAAAFPATDVVLVLDVSGSMEVLAEIPEDFPHREEYRENLRQLTGFVENRSQKRSIGEVVGGVRSGVNLAQLQTDIDTYFQTHSIDPKTQSRLAAARRAANSYLDLLELNQRLYGTDDRVSIVTFASTLGVNQPLTNDFGALRATLNRLEPLGGTNMGAGIEAALGRLGAPADGRKQQIILLTDGFTNEGLANEQILEGPARRASARGVPIYTIGFGLLPLTVDGQFLGDLAKATGGAYHFADSPQALNATLAAYQSYRTGQVLARFEGSVSQGQDLTAGTVTVPDGRQSMRMSLTTTPGNELDLTLVGPGGRELSRADPNVSLQRQGAVTLLTVTNPQPGPWKVLVNGRKLNKVAVPAPYAIAVSTEGESKDLPIATAAAQERGPDRWRPYLLGGSAVAGALALLFLVLTFRGLFSRRASTAGGCFSGCLTVLLVLAIGLGWGGYYFWNAPLLGP